MKAILSIATGAGLLVTLWYLMPMPEILYLFFHIVVVPVLMFLGFFLIGAGGYAAVTQYADGMLKDLTRRWQTQREKILAGAEAAA